MHSAIYTGQVRHRRFQPTQHQFTYKLMQWWLALDELEEAGAQSKWLSTSASFAPLHFKATDYLRDQWQGASNLSAAVLNKMNALNEGEPLQGRVFFLGNIRCWGLFFSPLNCYFLQQSDGRFSHMLAEVSNTPWNQRHYYLVDLAQQAPTEKAFHVSPFNPMKMQYQWKINQPGERQFVHIEAHRSEREFDATMALKRQPLNRVGVRDVLKSYPVMSLKIVAGIYWQALKLFVKRTPLYGHPGNGKR
ncbi:DUF1365 domain-containing protein [Aliidiomarina soli]|uniref:DUF1365 domain-containing protein n=1 Tax=Aliidiomarina soli TaxID=1928574 RepID=A0A432WMN5_9GAMM|nr:DUF1365 domain-containing protein [Aliidiomarina soli]RUO35053.1 DUF1365 domain-containing protein [Aliidiomarina soli]